MAKKRSNGVNQSQFMRELLASNPNAVPADAKKAWSAAGNKGMLTGSLYYIIKKKLGLTSPSARKRGRPVVHKSHSGSLAPAVSAKGYEEVEHKIDEVVHLLWELGDHDLAGEFRTVRRKVAARLA